ncbi:bestrophin family protein [Longitalea luteola]|uniref:bestrophin family protein n=1 Tax=Longitalea luteola TaxID=2812563 RepID=UPI001A9611A6|nr:bestrophin family ion channel [Longitalea luteola]
MLLEKKFPLGYIVKKVRFDLVMVILVGLCAHFISDRYENFLPEIPLNIPIFLGTAISVLLSFKMNQSYDRWWEARKIWGSIVNDSRNLIIQLQSFLKKDHISLIRTIAYRQIAWCYCLGQSLRGLPPLENIHAYVSKEDLEAIRSHNNKPLAIVQLSARDLQQVKESGDLDVFSHVELNSTLCSLVDYMGMAERINNTVFPVTYRYYLHLIIYIFVVTLSIAMEDVDALFKLPLLVLICGCFFLIEKSAYHLQDPFRNRPSDTPMTSIARTIEINIRQLLGEKEVPAPLAPKGFYVY